MPPQTYDSSDAESDVPTRNTKKKQYEDPDEMEEEDQDQDGKQEDEEDDDEAEDEYVVEAIQGHKFDGKTLMLLVKWKGYEKKSDRTWEPEENCEGAKEIVREYFRQLGGRPEPPESKNDKKRSRSSGGPVSNKKKKSTPVNDSPAPAEEAKWKPPAGSWEDEIQAIDTIEKTDKGLICYVQWGNGKKSQHEVHTVYKKAPQRMLHFYEQHLVFKESTGQNSAYKESD